MAGVDSLSFFLWPILPINTATGTILHNLVILLFTIIFFIFTLYYYQNNLIMIISKVITIIIALIAAIWTSLAMSKGSTYIENNKNTMGTFSIIVAGLATMIGTVTSLYYDGGTFFWIDLFVTITNIFWLLRNSELMN